MKNFSPCRARSSAKNHVDTLLGPGLNIHRSPLNGRNFEYFSEDPLLTGKLAAAQLRGMRRFSVTGTIKHFAATTRSLREPRSIPSFPSAHCVKFTCARLKRP